MARAWTDEEKLLSDLGEVSAYLVEWAEDQMRAQGKTPAEVLEMLREAVRIAERD